MREEEFLERGLSTRPMVNTGTGEHDEQRLDGTGRLEQRSRGSRRRWHARVHARDSRRMGGVGSSSASTCNAERWRIWAMVPTSTR